MLSDTKIKTLRAKDKNYSISDGQGLQLLIKMNNSRLWEFRYTSPTILNKNKKFKRRKTSFGNYPQTTLKTTRAKRNEFIDLINQGIAPLEQKKEDKLNMRIKEHSNFKLIADEWLEFEAKRTIEATFKNDITHQDIIEVVKKKSKKGLEGVNKLFRNLNTVWKYAITKGLCNANSHLKCNKTSQNYATIFLETSLKNISFGV